MFIRVIATPEGHIIDCDVRFTDKIGPAQLVELLQGNCISILKRYPHHARPHLAKRSVVAAVRLVEVADQGLPRISMAFGWSTDCRHAIAVFYELPLDEALGLDADHKLDDRVSKEASYAEVGHASVHSVEID